MESTSKPLLDISYNLRATKDQNCNILKHSTRSLTPVFLLVQVKVSSPKVYLDTSFLLALKDYLLNCAAAFKQKQIDTVNKDVAKEEPVTKEEPDTKEEPLAKNRPEIRIIATVDAVYVAILGATSNDLTKSLVLKVN